jgi:hypothetical protein
MTGAKGPQMYENWKAKAAGASSTGWYEFSLFSDAEIWWHAPPDLGPLTVFGTIVLEHNIPVPEKQALSLGPRPGATQVLAVRVFDHVEPGDGAALDWAQTDDGRFHGGGPEDEIASLFSLLAGARLRAGGTTRISEGDALGKPLAVDAQPIPQLPVPAPLRRVLPRAWGRHPINFDLLPAYPELAPDAAVAVVRAATLYRNAIWIAESDPNSAWLMLVSALEVGAVQSRLGDGTPEEIFAEMRPALSAAIMQGGGPELHAQVARELAPLLGATNRFIKFVLKFLPAEPPQRPAPAFQHRWSKTAMKETLDSVYRLRSGALHSGVPFPKPMCEPPPATPDHGVFAEKPLGATSTGGGLWTENDIPIFLQTFEYLARGALLNWWRSL